jgi:hypothetical protein
LKNRDTTFGEANRRTMMAQVIDPDLDMMIWCRTERRTRRGRRGGGIVPTG